jgi:hypothetical protein
MITRYVIYRSKVFFDSEGKLFSRNSVVSDTLDCSFVERIFNTISSVEVVPMADIRLSIGVISCEPVHKSNLLSIVIYLFLFI